MSIKTVMVAVRRSRMPVSKGFARTELPPPQLRVLFPIELSAGATETFNYGRSAVPRLRAPDVDEEQVAGAIEALVEG